MKVEPITIPTDTTPLDGLLYLPADRPLRGAVQLMHGNTMNFYVGPPRFLPPALVEQGFACLAYNRRGHDVLSNRDSRELEGGAYQTIAEAVEDNRLAREWLLERGYGPPVVIGHSNGGTLGVRHVADHPTRPPSSCSPPTEEEPTSSGWPPGTASWPATGTRRSPSVRWPWWRRGGSGS